MYREQEGGGIFQVLWQKAGSVILAHSQILKRVESEGTTNFPTPTALIKGGGAVADQNFDMLRIHYEIPPPNLGLRDFGALPLGCEM